MPDKFEKLPLDKQKKILDACISEFADRSYNEASTNRIVKNAGISKGLLFHYFVSKEKLAIFVLNYSLKKTLETTKKYAFDPSTDIFELILKNKEIRQSVQAEIPVMSRLIKRALNSWPDPVMEQFRNLRSTATKPEQDAFFKNIDKSMFRDDIDSEKAVEIIMLFVEGYLQRKTHLKKMPASKDIGNIDDELSDYINILKKCFYK